MHRVQVPTRAHLCGCGTCTAEGATVVFDIAAKPLWYGGPVCHRRVWGGGAWSLCVSTCFNMNRRLQHVSGFQDSTIYYNTVVFGVLKKTATGLYCTAVQWQAKTLAKDPHLRCSALGASAGAAIVGAGGAATGLTTGSLLGAAVGRSTNMWLKMINLSTCSWLS